MLARVIKPFLDTYHLLKRRKVDEVYNEKVARVNDLADAGYVVKVYKKKPKNAG